MIRIGFSEQKKKQTVREYVNSCNIEKVYCFYYKGYPIKFNLEIPVKYIEYSEIIMYRTFYPLLEAIDDKTLLIFNECLRTQNRSELTYNCAHHYLNQTPHRIIFEYFPFIDTKDDFMVLLDFENKDKYKGKSFDYLYLKDEDIVMRPVNIKLTMINVEVTESEQIKYNKYRDKLFNNLGMKDPDTIPRNLQLFAGDIKKKAIEPDRLYVARNKRFSLDNVKSYTEITEKGNYTVIDMHYRKIDFNDFLKINRMNKITYLTTVLSIDNYITNEFIKWKARLDAIYGQANIC